MSDCDYDCSTGSFFRIVTMRLHRRPPILVIGGYRHSLAVVLLYFDLARYSQAESFSIAIERLETPALPIPKALALLVP